MKLGEVKCKKCEQKPDEIIIEKVMEKESSQNLNI